MDIELASFGVTADARAVLEALGVDPEGARRLAFKAIMRPVVLRGVKGAAANLLKQEMLARGGDCAVPSRAVMHPAELVDACLLGTLQDYRSLLKYLRNTPLFGLPEVGQKLGALLASDFAPE